MNERKYLAGILILGGCCLAWGTLNFFEHRRMMTEDNCNTPSNASHGRTLMLPVDKDGIAWGISMAATTFKAGEKIGFEVRADNRTDSLQDINITPGPASSAVAYDLKGSLADSAAYYGSCGHSNRFDYSMYVSAHSCFFEGKDEHGRIFKIDKIYLNQPLAAGTYDVVFSIGNRIDCINAPDHKPPGPSLRITVE